MKELSKLRGRELGIVDGRGNMPLLIFERVSKPS